MWLIRSPEIAHEPFLMYKRNKSWLAYVPDNDAACRAHFLSHISVLLSVQE